MRSRTVALAAVADVVAVVVFAAVGRASHGESDDLLGLLATAAPFLMGAAAAWALGPVRRRPASLTAGLAVWAGSAVIGLALRAAFTDRLPLAFVLVAIVVLAVLLIGWRAIAIAVAARAGRIRIE